MKKTLKDHDNTKRFYEATMLLASILCCLFFWVLLCFIDN